MAVTAPPAAVFFLTTRRTICCSLPPARPIAWGRRKGPCWSIRSKRTTATSRFSGAGMSGMDMDSSNLKRLATQISESLKGASIFLVGINCSMKTNVGELLADAFDYSYLDSDSLLVEAAGGISEMQLLSPDDEQKLHDLENEMLKELSSMGRLVVCAGDGAVKNSTNLVYLRYGISIWIDVPLDILAEDKYETSEQYPFPNATPVNSQLEMLDVLAKCYAELKEGYSTADFRISLQGVASQLGCELEAVTPDDMALEILNEIEKMMRKKKMIEDAAKPF